MTADEPRPLPAEVETARADPRRVVGRYVLLDPLGEGGMGVVYRAFDTGLHRPVAIKMIRSLGTDPAVARQRLARFHREASATGRLRHEGIVGIHEVGEHRRRPFIVMDIVDGESLHALFDRETVPPRRLARIVAGAARALAHAHDHGVIHRDIKPENVLVDRDGRPRIVDFGLAMDMAVEEKLTLTGQLMGTPLYMAPEQLGGQDVDPVGPLADVYALGGILYRGLTGAPPFTADTMINIVKMLVKDDPVPPRDRNPATPPALEAVTLRCLKKRPADRFPSAAELAAELERFLEGDAAAPLDEKRRSSGSRRVVARRASARAPAPSAGPSSAAIAVGGVGAAVVVAAVALLVLPGGAPDPATSRASAPTAASDDAGIAAASPETEAATARSEPAPPPPADADWQPAWSSTDGAPPRLVAASLWSDDGRIADPLRGVREDRPDALAAAFTGEATRVSADRVRLRYHPRRHGRVAPLSPGPFFGRGGPVREADPDAAAEPLRVEAPNDAGKVALVLGEARWDRVRIEARLSIRKIDASALIVARGLSILGRERLVTVSGARAPLDLADGAWHELAIEPGAEEGRRFRLDGAPLAAIDAALATAPLADGRPWPGRAAFILSEGDFGFGPIVLEGRCRRTDRPAAAIAPTSLPAAGRVAVGFRIEDEPLDGGPFVALGDPTGDAIVAELAEGRLILRHGRDRIAEAELAAPSPAAGAEGWLILERRGDRLDARAAIAGATATIAACEPLAPPAATIEASWGSTGPRVRLGAVAVHRSDANARLAATADDDPVAAWRAAALALARIADPTRADADVIGQLPARARLAAEVHARLRTAADRLDDPIARQDALARAAYAAVIAQDADRAAAAARDLVAAAGVEIARSRIDQVVPLLEHRSLSRDLIRGMGTNQDAPRSSLAATLVAEAIAPESLATILHARASALRELVPRELPPDQARPRLEEILALLERSIAHGERSWNVESDTAQVLERLGREREATAHWRISADRAQVYWFPWSRLGQALARDGDLPAAVEATLVAFSLARNNQLAVTLGKLIEGGRLEATRPGLVAVTLLILADPLGDSPAANDLHGHVRRITTTIAANDPADGDLLLYAAARLGGTRSTDDERPTADLVRARIAPGDRDRIDALGRAAGRDRLVRALAMLDPALAPLVASTREAR